ncbi:hypothetical protein HN011_011946 [Eciton burchellii]|nr:hypothetical protein HN011_011946 [Eciton burchellii]
MSHRKFTSSPRRHGKGKSWHGLFIVTINNHDNQLTYSWHLDKLILDRSRFVVKRKELVVGVQKNSGGRAQASNVRQQVFPINVQNKLDIYNSKVPNIEPNCRQKRMIPRSRREGSSPTRRASPTRVFSLN